MRSVHMYSTTELMCTLQKNKKPVQAVVQAFRFKLYQVRQGYEAFFKNFQFFFSTNSRDERLG